MPEPLRVGLVPGLAVRRYLIPALDELTRVGVEVDLFTPPARAKDHESPLALGASIASAATDRPLSVLVGHSVGAVVAAAAAAAGGRIGTIVLISPIAADSWRGLAAGWLQAGPKESAAFVAEQAGEWVRTRPRYLARTLRATHRVDIDELLDRVPCPVHVIRGERDPLTTSALGQRLVRGTGRLHVVPGSSHSWPRGDASGFAARILDVADAGRQA